MAKIVKYYINGILQDYSPPVPDPTQEIILNKDGLKKAILGYPDEVDKWSSKFKVCKTLYTIAELTLDSVCFTIDNDGTWYGYLDPTFGAATPNTTAEDYTVRSFLVKADGTIQLSFEKAAALSKVVDTNGLPIEQFVFSLTGHLAVVTTWNAITSRYESTNTDFATSIIAADGTDVCGKILDVRQAFREWDYLVQDGIYYVTDDNVLVTDTLQVAPAQMEIVNIS